MKIKKNGIVSFSIRKRDNVLRRWIEGLEEGDGAHEIRKLLEDGLRYRQMVKNEDNILPGTLTIRENVNSPKPPPPVSNQEVSSQLNVSTNEPVEEQEDSLDDQFNDAFASENDIY